MKRSRKSDYWQQSRLPWPSLVFLMPMLIAYEVGVIWVGGSNAAQIRSGADVWLRGGLEAIGLGVGWLPPLLVIVGLLTWQWIERHPWRVSAETLASIRDLLPDADVVAVGSDGQWPHRLATLPLALRPGATLPDWQEPPATGTNLPLLGAWAGVISALVAGGLLLGGALALSERRGVGSFE